MFDIETYEMTADQLEDKLTYTGMEKNLRKLVYHEHLVTVEKLVLMTTHEVCELVLQHYEYVGRDDEELYLVKKTDMKTYNNIVRMISRYAD